MRRAYTPPQELDVREEHDAAGRVTARIVNGDENHPQSVRIAYDDAGRVISHIVAGDPRHRLSYRCRYNDVGTFEPLDPEEA
jgi:YD repeat-containing protein